MGDKNSLATKIMDSGNYGLVSLTGKRSLHLSFHSRSSESFAIDQRKIENYHASEPIMSSLSGYDSLFY